MRQEKWIRFRLLIVSAFIFPYICWTDEENKSESDVILPRCDKFHEMDESYFELLELLKAEAENKGIVKKTFLDPSLKTVKKHEPAGDTPTKGLPKDQPR